MVPAVNAQADAAEEAEAYDRSMSPPLIDIRKLSYEERQIDIVTAKEDLRALVSRPLLIYLETLNANI